MRVIRSVFEGNKHLRLLNTKGFKTAVWFTGGNFLSAGISAISGLLYGRWIDPSTLGEFNKYGILTGYMGLGIIFVDGAFQRHFPYYLGKNEHDNALKIAAVAKWWYLVLVYLGLVVFGSLCISSLLAADIYAFFGWLVQIPAYAFATYGLYLKILYRSNNDFLKLNKNLIVTSVLGIFSLPLVYFFKYTGLAIRSFLQNVSNILVHFIHAPYRVKAKFDPKGLIELAKISLPLQIPVYLDSHVLKATVSLLILNNLGEESLGIYAMAVMLQGFLLVFSRSLNQIFTTKTMLNYGQHENVAKTFSYIIRPTIFATLTGVLVVTVFDVTIPFAITNFLPNYRQCIPLVQILAFELVLALARGPFTLFVSALMYQQMVWLRILKMLTTLTMAYFWRDWLLGICLAIMLGEILYIIGGYAILRLKISQSVRRNIA